DADPEHLAVAEENLQKRVACRVKFLAMDAAALEFPTESFDVVLNRHAPAHPAEVARVLKPGGTFITQQVGARNTANICTLFGCGPGGLYADDTGQEIAEWANEFRSMGLVVRVRAEYDVPYFFCDVESLVFWLKAIPMPEDFDITRHWSQVDEIIATTQTLRGFATNEHRELLVVQKT
ncbi:MAG: class I SAM-dependent methyltransferase, partial [Anaerolineae bacterium]|nr:class I SAM-dependent methyltransferase [Anaerolineae bacterium]